MSKRKEMSEEVKKTDRSSYRRKTTHREVAALFGISKLAITGFLKRYEIRKTVENKPRNGRPNATTERDNKILT